MAVLGCTSHYVFEVAEKFYDYLPG